MQIRMFMLSGHFLSVFSEDNDEQGFSVVFTIL